MNRPAVRTVNDVDQTALDSFLQRQFHPSKAEFLKHHGEWWHRGQSNRWVIEEDGEIAGYCAVIPTTLLLAGEPAEAVWWVDLVVAEAHRGRGLQKLFDQRVRSAAPLIVGFPNALAAAIHRRHGWGVRNDIEVRLLPLRPRAVARRRAAAGGGGLGLVAASLAAEPYARWLRRRLHGFRPRWSGVVEQPSASSLARIASVGDERNVVTTHRDADYLTWRYREAPYRDELSYVVGGRNGSRELVAVLRVTSSRGATVARVLDLFGNLGHPLLVRDVMSMAAQHALAHGACQVTALAGTPTLSTVLRRVGFLQVNGGAFCWTTELERWDGTIEGSDPHFVLGDSDNDAP